MKLEIRLHNQVIYSLDLVEGKEYIAGRSDESDIYLQGEKGISRQHLKIYYSDSCWKVELLSKFGALIYNEESFNTLDIKDSTPILVPPFELRFINSSEVEKPTQTKVTTKNSTDMSLKLTDEEVNPAPKAMVPANNHTTVGNLEKTFVGAVELVPLLEVTYPDGEEETFKLEGNSWVAGRDSQCELYIRNDNASRQHFELARKADGFYISDLGSSNGTRLNGEKLEPNTEYKIESGDEISIKKISIKFTMQNPNFDAQLEKVEDFAELAPYGANEEVPIESVNPLATHHYSQGLTHYENMGPGVIPYDEPQFNFADIKTYQTKHKIRAIAVLGLAFFVWMLMSDSKPKVEEAKKSSESQPTGYAALSKDQAESVKRSLELAQLHYNGSKYSSCLNELTKIHMLLPSGYGNSLQLKTYCESGLEQTEILRQNQEDEQKRRLVELKIIEITNKCRKRMDSFASVEEANSCLFDAMELNPAAPEISQIRKYVEDKFKRIEEQNAQRADYARRLAQGKAAYEKALKVYQSGDLKLAIKELNAFLNTTYPDPDNNKDKARTMISEARNKIDSTINESIDLCEKQKIAKNYKEAMKACNKATKQDPQNKRASQLKAEIRTQIASKMREFYENASIEENYGNIESAKELWNKIASEDFEDGSPYYLKAKLKLKQYGQ